MKILSARQLHELDTYTVKNDFRTERDLVESAGKSFVDWFAPKYSDFFKIKIFCGLGNNGADGLEIAKRLTERGYQVDVYVLRYAREGSSEFENILTQVEAESMVSITELKSTSSLPVLTKKDVVIDAIFGIGLDRGIKGFVADIIAHINKSRAEKIAVDIPSGLFADKHTESEIVVQADRTISFEFAKLAFFFGENSKFVGEWEILPIGLSQEYAKGVKNTNSYMVKGEVANVFSKYPRSKFSHKGDYGHALIVAGSHGKMGASVLAVKGCLHSGAGLVTAHVPSVGYEIMQISAPEAMVEIDNDEKYVGSISEIDKYDAIGIGPGLDTKTQTKFILKEFLKKSIRPLVLDADALNILSENQDWLTLIPKDSILTPHPGEFRRLAGDWKDEFERLKMLRDFASKYKVYIILKGANTAISTPTGEIFFNTTGNVGMATGGMGDVLTGIITSLLAQGFKPFDATRVGVYVHGLAGDLAVKRFSEYSLTAQKLIDKLGEAFKILLSAN